MKVVGIIAEYNPFHNGHKYHIEQSKKITNSDYCIVAMSGNYVQRGEPAIVDKWTRTKMALENGADMVIEIPSIYSSSSAELFAYSAVSILNSTNIISSLCFGCETDNITLIKQYAEILYDEPFEYKQILKEELSKGIVFPKARENALKIYTNKDINILNTPNNILAIEYIKAIIKLKSKIEPYSVKRYLASYHSININNEISSATAIRLALENKQIDSIKKVMPDNCYNILSKCISKGEAPVTFDSFSSFLHYKLRTTDIRELSEILDITEGLENRILNLSKSNYFISDIVAKVKTKRYTYTKIQRALLHIILDFKKTDAQIKYIRVLGFRKQSEQLFSMLNNKCELPIVTNMKRAEKLLDISNLIKKEIISTDIYYLAMPSQKLMNKEYTSPIVVL